jgi:hypothetical protein
LAAFEAVVEKYAGTNAAKIAAEKAKALRDDEEIMGKLAEGEKRKKCKRLWQMAENYRKNGAKEMALTKYREIVKLLPESELGRKAAKRIKELQ